MTSLGALPVVASGDECSFVMYPDGLIDQPLMGTFDNLEAAIEHFRAQNVSPN